LYPTTTLDDVTTQMTSTWESLKTSIKVFCLVFYMSSLLKLMSATCFQATPVLLWKI